MFDDNEKKRLDQQVRTLEFKINKLIKQLETLDFRVGEIEFKEREKL